MKPTIMVFGVFHLDDHVLEPHRQEEIRDVVDRLARFRPTKIAVEVPTKHEEQVNQDYKDFLADTRSITSSGQNAKVRRTSNEVYQLAFRLAETCGHSKIHATDWMEHFVIAAKQE